MPELNCEKFKISVIIDYPSRSVNPRTHFEAEICDCEITIFQAKGLLWSTTENWIEVPFADFV